MKTETERIEYAIEYINKSAFSEYTKKVLMELAREEKSSKEFFFFMLKLAIAERPLPERTKEALL
jgi:hypothetical protein